jgi:ATP-dependent helicase/nuclease subunit B
MGSPFVEQLIELCRQWPTRSKWVVVPSHSIGHTLGDRLVLSGTNWTNLRFVTPFDLALRMAGPFLVEREIDPCEDTLGPALMIRLLLELPDKHSYFKATAEQPSIGAALWTTIRELRMAGISARDLAGKTFGTAAKKGELTGLLAAYEAHLKNNRLADNPAVFEEAAAHIDFCPIQSDHCWIELPDTAWPFLERHLLALLPGEHIQPRGPGIRGVNRPRRLSKAATATDINKSITTDADRVMFFLDSVHAPPPLSDGSFELFHAGGRDAEIEEVFRRIHASAHSLDQIEIACATYDVATLAWEKARLHGWPVTTEYGLAAAATRPGRALLAWCDWIDRDFDAAALRRLLQSGDLNPAAFKDSGHPDPFSPGQAARLLLRAEAAWGRSTYVRSLSRYIAQLEARAADPDYPVQRRDTERRSALRTKCLLNWVEDLINAVPSPDENGQVRVRDLFQAAISFLDHSSARASAMDAAGLTRLKDSLAELNSFGDYRTRLQSALRFVREQVAGLRIGADRMRPGHLLLSRLSQAGMSGRSIVFVAGLEEGRVFTAAMEDPVLLDTERTRISERLRTSHDRLEESVYAVASSLVSLDASKVCFSFSSRDTRQFRETFPSWLVLEALRLKTGRPAATFDHLKEALDMPVSRVPKDSDSDLSNSAWWLYRIKVGGSNVVPSLLEAFPALALGRKAEELRRRSDFSEFDGYVPAAGPVLDPSRNDRSISATTLEDAATCPFRFFLRRGLGVEPLGEPERQADVWLDPMTRGSELHALYAEIMREVRAEGHWPPGEHFLDRIEAMGEARLRQLRDEMPPPSDEVFDREANEFMHDLELFMTGQRNEHGVEGIGFEVAFGIGPSTAKEDSIEPLSNIEPVAIKLRPGRVIRLRGRIDRINRLADGSYEIVDYKTGKFWRKGLKGMFAQGTRLQHALYSIAAQWLLTARGKKNAEIRHAAYLFPTERGWYQRFDIPQDGGKKVLGVLNDLCDVIEAGAFVHADESESCKWCEFSAACGREPFDCSATKLSSPATVVLGSFRRLKEHE